MIFENELSEAFLCPRSRRKYDISITVLEMENEIYTTSVYLIQM